MSSCAPGASSTAQDDISTLGLVAIEVTNDEQVATASVESQSDDATWDQALLDGAVTAVAHVESDSITARSHPRDTARIVADLTNPTPMGGPLVFRVANTDLRPTPGWVQVFLPIRPNGTTGWVRRDQITFSLNPFRIDVDVAGHSLTITKDGEPWLESPVAIGTGDTPTPLGEFYIVELLKPADPDGVYGPFAFGLSGFSETLTDFAGGIGVIGIHGTNDPSSLGSDVSHGCIRLDNDVITHLATEIPLGTPVRIG